VLDARERQAVEDAALRLEEALKGNDKAAIDGAIATLNGAAQKIAEKMNSQQRGAAQGGEPARPEEGRAQEDVVDADFREVKGA
jgi:molecular chaperone DnaK